jgi:hypothetical protein
VSDSTGPAEPLTTRQQLEAAIRAILPSTEDLSLDRLGEPMTVASVGLAGVLSGYAWGRIRGRRLHKHKKRHR